jgi:hypothetical protein
MQTHHEKITIPYSQASAPSAIFLVIAKNVYVKHWRSLLSIGVVLFSGIWFIKLLGPSIHDHLAWSHATVVVVFIVWYFVLIPSIVTLEETFHAWVIVRKSSGHRLAAIEFTFRMHGKLRMYLKSVRVCIEGKFPSIDMLHIALAGPAAAITTYSSFLLFIFICQAPFCILDRIVPSVLLLSPVAIPMKSIFGKGSETDGAIIRKVLKNTRFPLTHIGVHLFHSLYLAFTFPFYYLLMKRKYGTM